MYLNLIPFWAKALITLTIATVIAGTIYKHGYDSANEKCIDGEKTVAIEADKKLADENEKVRIAQQTIEDMQLKLANRQLELQNAKIAENTMQPDLLSGRKRLPVLVTVDSNSGTKQTANTTVGAMDNGTQITAKLAPEVAANLDELAAEGDGAIIRLNACIDAYNSIKIAADSLEESR